MKIISLQAENFKKITAVNIEPDSNVIPITGKNGAGKTSVLDAIFNTLAGTKNAPDVPIHNGSEKAEVTIDLGDFKVTRTWKGDTSTLKIVNPDNSVKQSPQKVLDALLGRFTFDPGIFIDSKPQDRRDALLDLIDVKLPKEWNELGEQTPATDPLSHIGTRRQEIYNQRTNIGRDLEKANGALSTAQSTAPVGECPARVSVSELTAELQKANEHNQAAHQQSQNLEIAKHQVVLYDEQIKELEEQIETIKELREKEKAIISGITISAEVDTSALLDQINAAGTANKAADNYEAAHAQINALGANVTALTDEYDGLTNKLKAIDGIKAEVLQNAKFPVEGLSIEEGDVTFNGIAFKDCSHAERLKISVAIGTDLNPNIRVMLIRDGEKFDSVSWEIIKSLATDNDYQVWIEKVDESGEVGVYIEDGVYGELPKPPVKKARSAKSLSQEASNKDMTPNDVITAANDNKAIDKELDLGVSAPDIAVEREKFDALEAEVIKDILLCESLEQLKDVAGKAKIEFGKFKHLGFEPLIARAKLTEMKSKLTD